MNCPKCKSTNYGEDYPYPDPNAPAFFKCFDCDHEWDTSIWDTTIGLDIIEDQRRTVEDEIPDDRPWI